MDSDAEEIWTKRLKKDVDVNKIKDKQSLLNEIDGTPDQVILISKKGKVFTRDLTEAKSNLKEFVTDLISGSDSIQSEIVVNNEKDIRDSTTRKQVTDIILNVSEIPKLDQARKDDIERVGVEKINKLIEEKGYSITREEILDANLDQLKSIRKFGDRLGISTEEAKEVLIREGFTLFDEERRFKK